MCLRALASRGIAVALLAAGTASCADLTEVPISGITGSYYTTPVGYDALVNAAYSWAAPVLRAAGRRRRHRLRHR
jgi:hypothetical protein